MINPIKSVKNGIDEFVSNHPLLVFGTTLYVAGSVVLSAAYWTVEAGMEGIERACGVKSQNITAKLEKKEVARGPNGEYVPYGVFRSSEGKKLELIDYPVVTEGKLFAGTALKRMDEGKDYTMKVFGSPKFSQRIVNAKPVGVN